MAWDQSQPLFTFSDDVELRDDSSCDSPVDGERDTESLLRSSEKPLTSPRNSSLTNIFFLTIATAARFFTACLRYLIPSFLRRTAHDAPAQPTRNGAQAALDGLRGLACLIVACYHFFGYSFEVNHGYVWDAEKPDGGSLASIWNLPILKLPISGPNMVAIFFIISGYVLTYRFLSLVYQGKVENALSAMSSATFRRWFRLYAPVFAVTAMMQVIIQMGFFENGRRRQDGKPYPPKGDTWLMQFKMFWSWWRQAVNVFTWNADYPDVFDGNIWTIPVEYRSSMVLFLVAIGTARVKTHLRLACIVVCMGWALNGIRWEIVLFLMGMLLAQIDVLLAAHKSAHEDLLNQEKYEPVSRSGRRWLWIPFMFATLYLCSIPWHHEGAYGWETLSRLDPLPQRFVFSTWQFVGASMMVFATLHCCEVQALFNWGPIQYLGHVSYALYLVHGCLVKWCTYSLKWDIFDMFKDNYPLIDGHEDSVVLDVLHVKCVWVAFLVFIPTLIIVSDMFMRAVDMPCVALGKKIWDYCTV